MELGCVVVDVAKGGSAESGVGCVDAESGSCSGSGSEVAVDLGIVNGFVGSTSILGSDFGSTAFASLGCSFAWPRKT